MASSSPVTTSLRRRRLLVMAGSSLVTLSALVLWDVQRGSEALVARAGEQNRLLASMIASDAADSIGPAEGAPRGGGDAAQVRRLFEEARAAEREAAVVVLFRLPGQSAYLATDGRTLSAPSFDDAIAAEQRFTRLLRDEAARIGLPRRQAIAGLATIASGPMAGLRLAVVSSIARERDYVLHERWRAFISLSVAIALVTAFAIFMLREMAKEQTLAASLARKEVELDRDEQLARADRLGSLAAMSLGVAHELATPLGVMSARVEQLGNLGDADPRAAKSVAAVRDQIERMRAIIQGFLALARGTPTRALVDVQAIASSAEDLVRHRFSGAGVELAVSCAEPARVRCDVTLVVQALANLLVNACEASQRGQRVSLRASTEERMVGFEVRDEGSGMSEEAIAKAAAPFFTTRANQGGTGLGLAIATEIAQHHGGGLTIERREDHASGMRVVLALPRAEET